MVIVFHGNLTVIYDYEEMPLKGSFIKLILLYINAYISLDTQ